MVTGAGDNSAGNRQLCRKQTEVGFYIGETDCTTLVVMMVQEREREKVTGGNVVVHLAMVIDNYRMSWSSYSVRM
jgi:hypothetical protein